MNKALKVTLKVLNYIIVISVLILAFLLVGIKILGFDIYTVLSGSMEPNYHVGALIYVKEQPCEDLKKGDTITFYLSENTISTHRIKEVIQEDGKTYYRTKGDANEMEDAKLTPYENVIGKVIFTVPLLGYLSNFIQKPAGKFVAICVSILLIIIVFILDSLTDNKNENKKKKVEVKNEEESSNNN